MNPHPSIVLNEFDLESGLRSAIDRLKQGDFQTRWDVAKTIPNFGAAAIAPLLTILEEEETDWELLWFVARVLGNLNDSTVITALVNLLQTTDHAEVAGMAAMSLANHGVAAVAALSELLQNDSTRLLAVQALVQIRHTDVVVPLLSAVNDSSPAVRSATIEALSHFYDPAISSILLAALDDLNPTVRKAAVTGLGTQAHQHNQLELTEHLKRCLWDFNLEVCSQAAIALGRVGAGAAADALFEVLQSPHTPLPLQIEAVRSLTWMNTTYALDRLQAVLHQSLQSWASQSSQTSNHSYSPSPVQREIIAGLGRVEPAEAKRKATEILLSLLDIDHPLLQASQTKQTIALSLGQLQQLAALEALIWLLADSNASVRFHAIAALKQLQPAVAYQRLRELDSTANLEPELQAGVTIALQEWGS